MLILNEKHLHRVLNAYATYFNRAQLHQGIQQQIPEVPVAAFPPYQDQGRVISIPVSGGLHHDQQRAT
jgi:putative transposase